MKNLILAIVIILAFASDGLVDWPQYLGPERNATSKKTGLLRSWPEDGPKVLWIFLLGAGYGGPVVSDGKVYVLDRIVCKKDVLRCIDLNTGIKEWSFSYDAPGSVSHDGSRSAPTIDGDFIYSCGCFGHVYCIDKKTHKPIWNKNVWMDFGGEKMPNWGIAQNPLVYNDLLILASQTEKAGVVAYNKLNGEIKWVSKPFPTEAGYVSPKVVKIDNEDQIIMVNVSNPIAYIVEPGENIADAGLSKQEHEKPIEKKQAPESGLRRFFKRRTDKEK